MMPRGFGFYLLALRIAVLWWLFLIAVSFVMGGMLAWIGRPIFDHGFASDLGLALPFFGALFFFPPAAILVGLYFATVQRRALAAVDRLPALLSIGSERSINLDLPAEQALKIVHSGMSATFVGTPLHAHANGVAACATDLAKSAALWPDLYRDNVVVAVSAEGDDRSVAKIVCTPRHLWLFATLFVDGGRCARHVRALETAIQDRVRAQRQALEAMRKQEASRARQSEAELSMLRAHIEPHFLFNTLAHVKASLPSAGTGPDEDVAERMLDALIDFLRSNSQAFTRTENTLGDELAMVESYLTLIRLRLGDRLRYTVECPPSLHAQRLPSAAVLVLVENAVKHGIERSAGGGAVAVRCALEEGRLSIVCENDGPPFEIASGRVGGLSNLQERLRLIHGNAFAMEFENLAAGRVRAVLSWPCAEEMA